MCLLVEAIISKTTSSYVTRHVTLFCVFYFFFNYSLSIKFVKVTVCFDHAMRIFFGSMYNN